MRRRRGSGAAPAEACGVWLDTAELKRRPLAAKLKTPTRILERKPPWVFTQPCTKQTTIPTFFSSHTDEKDKENSRPSPFTSNQDSKDTAFPLAACPVKILALPQMPRDQPFGSEEGEQLPPRCWAGKAPLPDSRELQVESQSHSKASCGAGGDSWCFSPTQDSESTWIIPHRSKPWLLAGQRDSGSSSSTSDWGVTKQEGQEVKAGLDFQPGLGAKQRKKPQQLHGVNSLIDFAETENINPGPGARPGAPGGVCSSPQSPERAQPLRERGQNTAGAGLGRGSPCRQLFCQDSEGNRVIAHSCWDRELPHCPHRDKSSCAASSQQLELSPELLFTQDSEGKRVIKHW